MVKLRYVHQSVRRFNVKRKKVKGVPEIASLMHFLLPLYFWTLKTSGDFTIRKQCSVHLLSEALASFTWEDQPDVASFTLLMISLFPSFMSWGCRMRGIVYKSLKSEKII